MLSFPVVDISYISAKYPHDNVDVIQFASDAEVIRSSKEFVDVLSRYGFLYVRGGRFTEADFAEVNSQAKRYFGLPVAKKMESELLIDHPLNKSNIHLGYMPLGLEVFNSLMKPDLKETFDFIPWMKDLPSNGGIPNSFLDVLMHVFTELKITIKILLIMCAIGLGLDDPNFFVERHQLMGKEGNKTEVRTTYYPEVSESINEDELGNQQRIGKHSDFGILTMLYQDQTGGLEARDSSNDFVEVVPLRDTFVVNCGMALERISGGILKATKHRVVINSRAARQTIGFFSKLDEHVVIEPILGEKSTYKRVQAGDFDGHYQRSMFDGQTRDSLNMKDGL